MDPFSGVGSTVIAALKNGRNAVGIEKERAYCNLARQRISDLREGRLKTRPINKPIHQPSKNDRIARMPEEWREGSKFGAGGK